MKNYGTKRNRAYTLVELMVALVCVGLILGSVIQYYMLVLQTTYRSQNIMLSSADASTATATIIDAAREARLAILPNDGQFTAPPGVSNSFTTTDTAGATVYTGMMLQYPKHTEQPGFRVEGGTSASETPPTFVFNRTEIGNSIWFYRSDAGGVPNPSSGQYLWEKGTDPDGTAINRYVIKTLPNNSPTALQFENVLELTREIQFKVVSRFQSTAAGRDTNETGFGNNMTAITGQCVLQRNSGGSAASTTNGHWTATPN
ncbi:MAG TPA: type II secretion system protein [Capsulimonadaceae bacterium]|jgi:type II secretory pathway pseudopilin PulG